MHRVDGAGAASRGQSEFPALLRTFYSQQPQTHRRRKRRRRRRKATGCYSFTDRNQQKPDIALDFFNLARFCTLSVYNHVYFMCKCHV